MEGAVSARRAAGVRSRGLAGGVACVAAVALAAWPVRSLAPGVGRDWEWIAGLYYVAHHGLRFGEQIVWTYGPLGFLNAWFGPALYFDDVLWPSWLFVALVQLLLAGVLLVLLRRALPLALAGAVAIVAIVLVPDRPVALGFACCVLAVVRDGDVWHDRAAAAAPYALGVLTGIALLGKLNQGVELAALALVTSIAVPWRRRALALCATLVATAAAGWLATGQALGDAWPYLHNSAAVVAGYAAAMGIPDPARRWTLAAALALGLLALALAWVTTRDMPSRRRWGLLALCVLYTGFAFKEGFVRQDVIHMRVFFGDMLLPLAILPARSLPRPLVLGSVAAGVVALGALVGAHAVAGSLNPYANAKAVADQVRTLASPARRRAIEADLRTRIRASYGIPEEVLAAVGRRTVMLWPFLWGDAAYAYRLNLRPLPALEAYDASTPALDRLSARMLASARAPERIVRLPGYTVDERNPSFEAPLATLAILCRYRQVAANGSWQALARSSDRCGRPRTLAATTARWGASVAVPPPSVPGALVLVRIDGAGERGFERLGGLLLRPRLRWISLDGSRFRLVAATAPDGLLLRAPANADYPESFAMAPDPSSISVTREGGNPGGTLRYTFVEVPIRPFAPAATRAG